MSLRPFHYFYNKGTLFIWPFLVTITSISFTFLLILPNLTITEIFLFYFEKPLKISPHRLIHFHSRNYSSRGGIHGVFTLPYNWEILITRYFRYKVVHLFYQLGSLVLKSFLSFLVLITSLSFLIMVCVS